MENTLTIDQLIQSLQAIKIARNLSGKEPVIVGSNYGDRNGTIQAIALNELETVKLIDSCYSDSGLAVYQDLEEPEQGEEVIMLNYDLVSF